MNISGRRVAPLPLCAKSGPITYPASAFPVATEPVEVPASTLDEQPVDAVVQSTEHVREVWQRDETGEWWGVGQSESRTSADLAALGPWRRIG